MIPYEDKVNMVESVNELINKGETVKVACEKLNISLSSYNKWKRELKLSSLNRMRPEKSELEIVLHNMIIERDSYKEKYEALRQYVADKFIESIHDNYIAENRPWTIEK